MRKAAALAALAVTGTAGAALAAGPTISASVTPNTPNSHSALKVSAKGPFTAPGLPTAVEVDVQKGFRSSAKSVSVLCNPSKLPCPAKSKVGSGEVVATVTILGVPTKQTIPFTMYLGKPQHTGDIASIVLTATVFGQKQHVTGRLFKSTGGLEILFDHLPRSSAPPGDVTLNRLSLSAHAVHKKGKKTYSLITNPPKCSSTKEWTGNITITFLSGPMTQPLSLACSK
jgi:hypothetical protein